MLPVGNVAAQHVTQQQQRLLLATFYGSVQRFTAELCELNWTGGCFASPAPAFFILKVIKVKMAGRQAGRARQGRGGTIYGLKTNLTFIKLPNTHKHNFYAGRTLHAAPRCTLQVARCTFSEHLLYTMQSSKLFFLLLHLFVPFVVAVVVIHINFISCHFLLLLFFYLCAIFYEPQLCCWFLCVAAMGEKAAKQLAYIPGKGCVVGYKEVGKGVELGICLIDDVACWRETR